MQKKKIATFALVCTIAALNVMIVIFPATALEAARFGTSLWFNSFLPGTLPFLIGVNVLMAFGAVKYFGLFLSPVMKTVFRLPGSGGFAFIMGIISGYPIGAKIVCEMRTKGELGRRDAQRLLGFSNNAGPLFILGAVGAGMFSSPAFGYLLLIGHYAGAIILGLTLRIFAKNTGAHCAPLQTTMGIHYAPSQTPVGAHSVRPPSLGQALASAVKNAMETMLIIGGFIILFSVISALLNQLSVISYQLSVPIAGVIEMTGGLGLLGDAPPTQAGAALAAAILGFGGLSILFQALSFIGKTDLSGGLYVLCKIAHAAIAAIVSFLLFPLFAHTIERQSSQAAFAPSAMQTLTSSASILVISLGVVLVMCLIAFFRKRG